MPRLFEQTENTSPNVLQRLGFGRASNPTENITLANFLTWLDTNLSFRTFKTAASGLPSTSGAGDIDFDRVNDYFSGTAITANVTWGIANIKVDQVAAIDCKVGAFTVTLVEAGITFKGAVDSGGIVQGLDTVKANLISLWAITSTDVWVTVIKDEA